MTIAEQYTNTVRQTQENWTGVLQSFTDNLQNVFGSSVKPFAGVDPTAAIDQVFDFWTNALESQRQLAKQLVGATVTTSETIRSQAESVGTAIREQVENSGTVILEHAESLNQAAHVQAAAADKAAHQAAKAAEKAAHDEAAKKYESLTKDELQDELARRNLTKTGNVDELRERLIAEDQK